MDSPMSIPMNVKPAKIENIRMVQMILAYHLKHRLNSAPSGQPMPSVPMRWNMSPMHGQRQRKKTRKLFPSLSATTPISARNAAGFTCQAEQLELSSAPISRRKNLCKKESIWMLRFNLHCKQNHL